VYWDTLLDVMSEKHGINGHALAESDSVDLDYCSDLEYEDEGEETKRPKFQERRNGNDDGGTSLNAGLLSIAKALEQRYVPRSEGSDLKELKETLRDIASGQSKLNEHLETSTKIQQQLMIILQQVKQ
jgi:hypothetical protein